MQIIRIFSFSYKRGLPSDLGPDGGGFVFDCRALPNPFWVENLRGFTGCDQPIIDFFAARADAVAAFLKPVEDLVRNSIAAYAQDALRRVDDELRVVEALGGLDAGDQQLFPPLEDDAVIAVCHGTPNRLVVKTKIQW